MSAPLPAGSSTAGHAASGPSSSGRAATHVVAVYSDDPAVRDAVRTAVGRRPAADLGPIEWLEAEAAPPLIERLDEGGVDVVVLDGEAWPTGGLGLARQLKDELADCPMTLVLIARRDDAWLATWSMADAVVPLPIDPGELGAAVAELLRRSNAGLPVRRSVH